MPRETIHCSGSTKLKRLQFAADALLPNSDSKIGINLRHEKSWCTSWASTGFESNRNFFGADSEDDYLKCSCLYHWATNRRQYRFVAIAQRVKDGGISQGLNHHVNRYYWHNIGGCGAEFVSRA